MKLDPTNQYAAVEMGKTFQFLQDAARAATEGSSIEDIKKRAAKTNCPISFAASNLPPLRLKPSTQRARNFRVAAASSSIKIASLLTATSSTALIALRSISILVTAFRLRR